MSPTTTTGDRRWKRTQERKGPHNNLAGEKPEGPITKSRAGKIVLTTIATNTDGKRWTPAITPDKWEKKGHRQRMTERNTKRQEPSGKGWKERGAKKQLLRTGKLWKKRSRTCEANSIALCKPSSQKTTTSNNPIRKSKNSNKPTIKPSRGCAKSRVCYARKEFSIVGPMREGEGS